jgi:hypothetical protein
VNIEKPADHANLIESESSWTLNEHI